MRVNSSLLSTVLNDPLRERPLRSKAFFVFRLMLPAGALASIAALVTRLTSIDSMLLIEMLSKPNERLAVPEPEFSKPTYWPKESALLWRRLAEAVPASAPLLERMRRGQAVAERGIRELGPLLSAWEMLGEPCREPFDRALAACRDRFLAQMRAEEDEVLGLAQRHFHASDWRALDAAFGAADERAGHDRHEDVYEAVLGRIRDAAPLAFDQFALPLGPVGLAVGAEVALAG